MAVSYLDGTVVEAEPGRKAASVRFFKKIVFRLADGSSKTIARPIVHVRLAEHFQPGTSGRFYLFTSIDHRGVCGLRDGSGRSMFHYPRNNEYAALGLMVVMGLWVGFVAYTWAALPIFPTLMLLLAIPFYILNRKTRADAERLFAADGASAIPFAPSPVAEPATGG